MYKNYKHFNGEEAAIEPSKEGAVIESNEPTEEEIEEGEQIPGDEDDLPERPIKK